MKQFDYMELFVYLAYNYNKYRAIILLLTFKYIKPKNCHILSPNLYSSSFFLRTFTSFSWPMMHRQGTIPVDFIKIKIV